MISQSNSKEELVMDSLKYLFLFIFVIATVLAAGCLEEEDETEIWEDYCVAAEECATISGQMFSMTECKLEYEESFERHESVGCEQPYENYLTCVIDLPCPGWGDVGESCAWEIDYLNACVQ
jgi:hypothetical protein